MIRLEDTQDFADCKNHIYGLAHSVCLNSIEQHLLLSAVREVEDNANREGWPNSLTIASMIGVIFDGLAYNNWPHGIKFTSRTKR